ncbi:MAG: HRDC domain-containing protein, partial [Desulfobacteraceae bacterium]|nr:HRDC domain-containing protein [Desulfobacteraceae bacterium]
NRLAEKLRCEPAVAVDLEADSMHHFEEKVCLLQLGTQKTCHIVDPLALGDIYALRPLFEDPGTVKILHGADYDVRCLYRDFHITVENLFDTELAARFLGYGATSLEAVLARHFNVTLDKKFQKKDWSVRPLPEEMIAYAADDVRHLVKLYEEIKAALKEKGRIKWLYQHCKDIAAVRPEPETHQGPFFIKIKGAGRLDPKSLAVLEAMLAFRRRTAQKKDRPPFKILGNKTLLALAQKKPKNEKELQKTGLLTRRQMQMYGEALLRQINSALSIPADQRPRYPREKSEPVPAAITRRIKKLKKWRQEKADILEIDPSLILNKNALRQVAEKQPVTRDQLDEIKELKPWQKDVFGKELISI